MKRRMLLGQISISAIFVVCLLTASANALDATNSDRMSNLMNKGTQLQKDILSVQKGSSQAGRAWECLNELQNKLETILARIEGLYSMITTASLMNDKLDEQSVLGILNEAATSFLNHIEISRNGIKSTVSRCSSITVTAAKAKEILEFYDEATSVVGSITKDR